MIFKKKDKESKPKKEKKVPVMKVGTHKKTVIALWLVLITSVSFGVYKNFTAIDMHTVHEKEVIEQRIVDTNRIENFVKAFAKSYYSWSNTQESIDKRTAARVEDCDKIKGFAIGADDYVVKPFSIDELEARVAAHLRREKRHSSSAIVQFDKNIVIDYSSRTVFYKNAEINFTKKEFDIIEFLSQNKGIVFDRETIYEKVWGLDGCGDNSVVTEHIRRIRTKFLSMSDNPYIETVWGCGYKWKK